MLRAAAGPTLVVGLLAVLIGGLTRGGPGVLAAVIGTVVVLAFFAIGQYVLGVVLANNPQAAMPAALVIYLVKVGILFGFIAVFADTTAFDPKVFGLTVLACTITWTCAEVWVIGKTKLLVLEPAADPAGRPSEQEAR